VEALEDEAEEEALALAAACLAAAAARWCKIHGCLGTSTNFIRRACSLTSSLQQ
jgi:hypothetical protein